MKTNLWTLGLAALMAVAVGCGDRDTDGSAGTRPQEIQEPTSVKVAKRDIVGYEFLGGRVYTPPDAEAYSYAPYRAPVERVLTSVGQRVRKGEVLAELSAPMEQADLEQARADVRAAEAALASAKSSIEGPVRELEREVADLRTREREIRSTTDPAGDATALVAATAARKDAQERLLQARAATRSELLPYEQSLAAARERLRYAQEGARQGNINAPISGTVLELDVQPGQEVGVSGREKVARVVDLDAIRIHSEVSPAEAQLVQKDTNVIIRFNELPDQAFTGKVTGVRTLPDSPGDIERVAVIWFENTKGQIKPEMRVKSVAVKTGEVEDVLAVPAQCVKTDDTGKPYVMVLVGQDWQKRVVETGMSDGDFIQIKSGLDEGDTVQVPATEA